MTLEQFAQPPAVSVAFTGVDSCLQLQIPFIHAAGVLLSRACKERLQGWMRMEREGKIQGTSTENQDPEIRTLESQSLEVGDGCCSVSHPSSGPEAWRGN